MTRGMFFKMLAALGLGQASGTLRESANGRDLEMWDGKKWVYKSVEELQRMSACSTEGEERCPLGHCQKPELGPNFVLVADEGLIGVSKAFTHYCSTCGIVYVPQGKKP